MAELPRLRVGLTLDSATFVRETNKVVDSVNRMSREIQSQNARTARSFDSMQRGIDTVSTGFRNLTRLIGIGSFALLGREIARTADAFATMSARLQLVTSSSEEAAAVQARLIQQANQNRASISDTVDLYTKLALTLHDQGVESDALLAVTKAVGQAVKISGSNAASASAGLTQFAQAMASGVLRGDELRSIMEQVPGLAKAIADGLGVPIGQLKALGEQGALTTEKVLNALLNQAPQIQEQFSKLPVTIGDSITLLGNAFAQLIGESDRATQSSRDLASAIADLASFISSSDFIRGFQEVAAAAIREVRRELELLSAAAGIVKDVLANFGLATLSLDEINSRIADTNEQLAKLNSQRESLAALAQEKGLAPESTQALDELNKRVDALFAYRAELTAQRDALGGVTKAQDEATDSGEQLDLNLNSLFNTLDFGKPTVDETAKAWERFAEQQRKRHDGILETIDDLNFEVGGLQRLVEAQKQSEDAYKRTATAIEAERLIRKAGISETGQEAGQIRRAVTERARLNDELAKGAEQIAAAQKAASEQQAAVLAQPLITALENVQNTFTQTFQNIYEGGVTTFGDLAEAIKAIFIRLAAEITTLMIIRPIIAPLTGSLAAGATGGAPSLAQSLGFGGFTAGINRFGGGLGFTTPTTVGAPLVAGGIPIVTPGAAGTFPLTLAQTLGFGAAGGLGGALVGSFFGGRGAIGGGLGGGVGAIGGGALGAAGLLGGSIGGPGGALIGGLGGALLGGFIGSLFGGGTSGNKANIQGGLGLAGAGGTGKAALFVRDFDKQLIELLDDRQRQIVDRLLKTAAGTSVKYDKELSEGDRARLAAGRIAPVARALGFRGIAGGGRSAEEQLARLGEALEVDQQVKDLVSGFGQFASQARDLKRQFDELTASAKEFGISQKGLAAAQRREGFELIRGELQRLGGVAPTAKQQLQDLNEQFRDVRQAAGQFGFSLKEVAAANRVAYDALKDQIAAQQEATRAAKEATASQLALSVVEPFQQMIDPLKAYLTSLDFANLSPMKQYEAAQRDFQRTLNLARAGSDIAINQLQGAGDLYIRLAEQVGASPGAVAARAEVSTGIETVLKELDRAQKEASKGLETEIRRANREQVDTLKEHIQVSREALAELKRLRRS